MDFLFSLLIQRQVVSLNGKWDKRTLAARLESYIMMHQQFGL